MSSGTEFMIRILLLIFATIVNCLAMERIAVETEHDILMAESMNHKLTNYQNK
jgi:hypothetical protein